MASPGAAAVDARVTKQRRHDTLNPHFPGELPFTKMPRCIARHAYRPDTSIPTESPKLPFEKGNIIVILSKDASGWWNGLLFDHLNGGGNDKRPSSQHHSGVGPGAPSVGERPPVSGWFPATYVDPWTPETAALERQAAGGSDTTALSSSSASSPEPPTATVRAVGHFAEELAGLRQSLSDLKSLDMKPPPTINTINLRSRKSSLTTAELPSPFDRRVSNASSIAQQRTAHGSPQSSPYDIATSPMMSALVSSATDGHLEKAATSPAWDALVEAVVQAVSQLNVDAKAHRKTKFVEHAVIVSINIRYLLKTSGCLDKGSPTLQRSRTLRHAHADLFRALTNLVKGARSAADPFATPEMVMQLRATAAHLLSATRAFVQAALQRDVRLTPLDSEKELKEIADMMGLRASVVFKDGRFQGVHTCDSDGVYIERIGEHSDLVQRATTSFLDAVAAEQNPEQLRDAIQVEGQRLTHIVGQLLAYLEEQQHFVESTVEAASLEAKYVIAKQKLMIALSDMVVATSAAVHPYQSAFSHQQIFIVAAMLIEAVRELILTAKNCRTQRVPTSSSMSPRSPLSHGHGGKSSATHSRQPSAHDPRVVAALSPTMQVRHRRANSAHDALDPEPSPRPVRSRLASIKIDTSVAQAAILQDKLLPLIPTPLVSAYPDGLKTDDSDTAPPVGSSSNNSSSHVGASDAGGGSDTGADPVVPPSGSDAKNDAALATTTTTTTTTTLEQSPAVPPNTSFPKGDDGSASPTPLGGSRSALHLSHSRDQLAPASASRESLNTLLRGDDRSERWYMRVHRNAQDIVFSTEQDGHIKAGTVKAILDELTSHAPSMHQDQENEVQWQFLETFRAFSTPYDFLQLLRARFNLPQPMDLSPRQAQDWQENFQRVVQARVSIVLKQWITHHYQVNQDSAVLAEMKAFVDQELASVFAKDAHVIDELLTLRLTRRNERPSLEQPPMPKLVPFSAQMVPEGFHIMNYEPLLVAKQLTIIDSFAFLSIERNEWLQYKPNTKARRKSVIGSLEEEKDNDHSNIRRMIQHSNLLTGWVAKTILDETDIKKRGAVVKHFIKIAQHCHQLNNFASRESILAAINSSPIYRLKRTFEYMSTKTKNTLAGLMKHMDRDTNRKAYRDALKNVDGACVPFLGLFLTDLTFTMDGNPTLVYSDRLINFDKFAKIATILENIYKLQAVMYAPMMTPPELYAGIQYGLERAPDADTLFDLSMEVEPREREDEKILRLLQEKGFG